MEKCNFTPYKGVRPYIFVSYAHADKAAVFPILERLNAEGFRIWYDEGIEWGSEWPDAIAEHIDNCHTCLCIISRSSIASKNCNDEINYAIDTRKNILVLYIEEVALFGGLKLRLSSYQSSFYYQYSNKEEFFTRFITIPSIATCKMTGNQTPIAPTATYTPSTITPPSHTTPSPSRVTTVSRAVRPTSTTVDTSHFIIRDGALIRYSGSNANVTIPYFITEIGEDAFRFNKYVKTVEFENQSQLNVIRRRAFCQCDNLTSITLPDCVTTIEEEAFCNCPNLQNVDIGIYSKLKIIRHSVFSHCPKLTIITIPDGVEAIEQSTFASSGITQVKIGVNSQIKYISAFAFAHTKLTYINVTEKVAYIGKNAFCDCQSLMTVNIGVNSALRRIESGAFANCVKLTLINLPDALESIEENAFGYCESLATINIWENSRLKTIAARAFVACKKLKDIALPQTVLSIEKEAFAKTKIKRVKLSQYCYVADNAFPKNCKVIKI